MQPGSRASLGIVVGLLACTSSRPPTSRPSSANATAVSPVRIAVAGANELRVVDVSPAGTKVLRSAKVSGRIDTLVWEGDDPIALLQHGSADCTLPEQYYPDHASYEEVQRDCNADTKVDGVVGRLTENGFVAYPSLPESTWSILAAPKDASPCTSRCWSIDVSATQVWLGHCKWVFSADGTDHCDEWAYVRLDQPGPATKTYPSLRPTSYELPTVAESPRVEVSFESVAPPPRYDGDEPEPQQQLHCALDGQPVLEYPDPKDLDAGMRGAVTWLATSPPIFATWHWHNGFEMTSELVVFDACKRMNVDRLVAGPDGLVAIVGDRLDIRRRGALVGSMETASIVVFAPR